MLMPTATRVWVAHPQPLVHRGIVTTLRAHGRFQVTEPGYGSVAPLPGDATPMRVFVTDLCSGIAAAQPRDASAPTVLVLSHLDGELSIRGALERGVKGYLTHDCQPEQLVEAVLALARGQRYLQANVVQRLADTVGQDLPTPRETEVLRLMAIGLCNKAIAAELNIGCGTVKTHVKALLGKLDAATRTAAADIAKRRGLLDPVTAGLAPAHRRVVRSRAGAGVFQLREPGFALT